MSGTMLVQTIIVASIIMWCDAVIVYSSFYAPLFDRRVLNYRVDAPFDPSAARAARGEYERRHGARGERLVAALGDGRGETDGSPDSKVYGEVKFYYT